MLTTLPLAPLNAVRPSSGLREDHARRPGAALQRVQAVLQEPAGHLGGRGGERRRGVDPPPGVLDAPGGADVRSEGFPTEVPEAAALLRMMLL